MIGGTGWYRCHLPAQHLRENGFEVTVGPVVAVDSEGAIAIRDWNNQIHDGFDIIVIQRWMQDEAAEVIRRARAVGQIVVSDVDDWFGGISPSNMGYQVTHPRRESGLNRKGARAQGIKGTASLNVDHYRRALAASSAITVSTPYLRDRLHEHLPSVPKYVLRNGIDFDRWKPLERPATDHPVIGWMGGTSHRSGDLETLKGILGPFLEQHGLAFHHSGHFPGHPVAAEALGIRPDYPLLSRQGMCSVLDLPSLFENIDVSIVPLSDNSFNNSKSSLKLLESVAAGVPVVASATSEYRWLHDQYGVGRIAKRPKDWLYHLRALLDPEVRIEEARAARVALKDFDMENHWIDWAKAYTSILAQ